MSSRAAGTPWVWIVSGPSGSGKTSLCEALLEDPRWRRRLARSVSYTTRPLRSGEKEGRDYHAISEKAFRALLRRRAFLEHEKIFGYYYGTPKKAVRDARRQGKDLLCCVDVKGARSIRRSFKGRASSIFILPPGPDVLRERLRRRSTETKKDMADRLRRAEVEISFVKDYDYVIVNDKFREALAQLKSILTTKRCKGDHALHSAGKTDR